jgi:quercetin dioxygenase-like cupin family protein
VEFGKGTAFPPHNHPHQQITFVMEGAFEIEIEGEKKMLRKGDTYVVPGNAMHAVKCMEKGVLMDTFSPMREDFLDQ